jgi:hypothetical protein
LRFTELKRDKNWYSTYVFGTILYTFADKPAFSCKAGNIHYKGQNLRFVCNYSLKDTTEMPADSSWPSKKNVMQRQNLNTISPNSTGISLSDPMNKKVCRLVDDDQAALLLNRNA